MMLKWVWVVAALVVVLVVMRGMYRPSGAQQATVREKLAQGARILDVRTPSEFTSGHFPGAMNLPVRELARRTSELGDTNQAIVVYCRSGIRSAQAVKILESLGFQDVTNAGGLKDMPREPTQPID